MNPQVSLLDLTVEAGIPDDVMRVFIGGKKIVYMPCHDGLLVDMVNEGIDEEVKWLLTSSSI